MHNKQNVLSRIFTVGGRSVKLILSKIEIKTPNGLNLSLARTIFLHPLHACSNEQFKMRSPLIFCLK
jgi:hypothetical protein